MGRSEGRAEIFVVFPRMKHKHPRSHWSWETKIPHEVEVFWLENVVYPVIRAVNPPSL